MSVIHLNHSRDVLQYLQPQIDTPITTDSRRAQPGGIFIAYRGVSSDGHDYVPQALAAGVQTLILERPVPLPPQVQAYVVPHGREAWAHLCAAQYGHPGRRLTVIGVTGTDGKTSTSNIIFHLLKQAGRRVGMISTVNAIIGDETLETGLHVTTPDPPQVQDYLARMVAAGLEVCILESTSHGLEQFRIDGSEVDLAVVTNITHEHLDLHGSLEAYRLAKARLFKMAGRKAILNLDDSSYPFLQDQIAGRIPTLSYGLHPNADLRASDLQLAAAGTQFSLHHGDGHWVVETPLVGAFNVSNVLAALATTVVELGVPIDAALAALRNFPGVPGRMERIDIGNPAQAFTAVVDFAHTPASLEQALETCQAMLAWQGHGRVIAIFGCAGLRDVEKRTLMGRISARLADITLITAEDPRTEDLAAIIDTTAQAMQAAGATETQPRFDAPQATRLAPTPTFIRIPDRGRALFYGVQLAQPGDIVIALGKGHEQSMCFGTTEYPWDDRDAMRAALRGTPLQHLPTAGF